MYVNARLDRNGKTYFSIRYKGDDGKMKRLKKSEHPIFESREEAEGPGAGLKMVFAKARKTISNKRLAGKLSTTTL